MVAGTVRFLALCLLMPCIVNATQLDMRTTIKTELANRLAEVKSEISRTYLLNFNARKQEEQKSAERAKEADHDPGSLVKSEARFLVIRCAQLVTLASMVSLAATCVLTHVGYKVDCDDL
eukprot:TRINITY_DN16398_c0_g1_i1.p1 TRINITY_DN16398_c0_g1~~TRINITY_DN16398_c0_g1_i1.p1  ORF type:complete len:120 (+),score=13.73 TRINITY_DN16398_c0_g1_i1:205-564(+)